MNTNIAENIRSLRKQKDITQEELSRFMGVSYQAISKWERGEGFPDITLLPSLSNFFEVSIDELFGMDQIRNQNYLNEVYIKEHEYVEKRKYKKALSILRKALKTFPTNYSLMSELAIVLSFSDVQTKEGKDSIKEAVALCEHVLINATNEKVRSTTRTLLCFLYKDLNDVEKAISVAKTLPHFWECRELILPNMHEQPIDKNEVKESIKVILSILYERFKQTTTDDNELDYNRIISLGTASYDMSSYDLKTIKRFIDEVYS